MALLFGGPAHHNWRNGYDYSGSFANHVVAPLRISLQVFIFVACESDQVAAWSRFFQLSLNLGDDVSAQVQPPTVPMPEFEATPFSRICPDPMLPQPASCTLHKMESYWGQYGHKWQSFMLMRHFESAHRVRFPYVVTLRNDVIYRSEHFLLPSLLTTLPCRTVALASIQSFQLDRWFEPPFVAPFPWFTWPYWAGDQLVMGSRSGIDRFFEFLHSKQTFRPVGPERLLFIEHLLGQHLASSNVSVVTFELQFTMPSQTTTWLPNGIGAGGQWLSRVCRDCWDPEVGTSRAGVGQSFARLLPCSLQSCACD